jgi:linoleoyl-CoA desaturase
MKNTSLAAQALVPARPRFAARSTLRTVLDRRVKAYFEESGHDPSGGARLVTKSLVILTWAVASYLLLLLWASSWWTVAPLAVSLGLALAGIGFSIMHDGGHGAFSGRKWVNRLAFGAVDVIGGSSYFWHHKHNVLHHTYTNVDGVDDDLDAGPFLRLAPTQRRRWFHRFQHWYELPLLGFLAAKWTLLDDWVVLARGKIGDYPIPRPRGWDLVQLVAGKVVFLSWAVVLPLAVHPALPVAGAFALTVAVLGITLGVVFQLAHVVEGTQITSPPEGAGERLELPWVEHQLATTADFSPHSRLVTWFVGGLNFQVEHHLFPRVSHVHYSALAQIVRRTCQEQGVNHLRNETLWGALRSHFRRLEQLGRAERSAPAQDLVLA